LIPDYANLALHELLQVVRDEDQLTDEARLALESELSRRRLTKDDIAANEESLAAMPKMEERKVREVAFSTGGHRKKIVRQEELPVRRARPN
jgi:hypothetical protein